MRVLKISTAGRDYVEDEVVDDIVFDLIVNDEHVVSFNTLDEKLYELVYGYLFTTGIITSYDDVEDITVTNSRAHIILQENFDLETILNDYKDQLHQAAQPNKTHVSKELGGYRRIAPILINRIMKELDNRGTIFKKTGGTHSALIYNDDKVIAFAEDIGRFNALDKVVGEALIEGIDFNDTIVATSGRLAGEMVLKAVNAGFPIICSVSAPINSGVNLAKASGTTLIGFARSSRFNVYSGFYRVP